MITIMSVRTFSCSNCDEPFSVHLPEDTTKAVSKCEDKDTTYHNLEHTIQCQNCEYGKIFYTVLTVIRC